MFGRLVPFPPPVSSVRLFSLGFTPVFQVLLDSSRLASAVDQDLNIRPDTLKLLQKKHREKANQYWSWKLFFLI